MRTKILLVEDEPSIADNIVYALKTEGFEVVWCPTAEKALAAFAEADFKLVVLDIGLPDINGFDVCKRLRKHSLVPIIFVTARKDEIDRVVGLEIGADDYVVKPFSPRELSARVKAVLRRSSQAAAPAPLPATPAPIPTTPVAPGEPLFAVDEDRLEIRYKGCQLQLSRYEYRLLKVLLDRPGKVFSRDELMERVWDEPGSALDRTVDAHIKTIRAKLHAICPDADPIRTYRGVGYSLAD
ncbi:MAG: two-component system response regulator CreB [Chthoniobacteraceae bacterium]|nr:two-component system response regulator CreB [Chthoniobacteraceae bacterium]